MEEVPMQIKTELAGPWPFGRKVHKCNNHSQKTKVEKKNRPKYSNIINIHLTSLNRFNPILRNSAEIVNPKRNKRTWGNPILEVKIPNIQEAIASFETSRQNLAISSFWRLVINKISLVQI